MNFKQPFQCMPIQQPTAQQQQQNPLLQQQAAQFPQNKGVQVQQFGQNTTSQFQQQSGNFQPKMQTSYGQQNQINQQFNPHFNYNNFNNNNNVAFQGQSLNNQTTQQNPLNKQPQNCQQQNNVINFAQFNANNNLNNAQCHKYDSAPGVNKQNSNDINFYQNQNATVEQSPKSNKQSGDVQFDDLVSRLKAAQEGVVKREKELIKAQEEALKLVNTDFTAR